MLVTRRASYSFRANLWKQSRNLYGLCAGRRRTQLFSLDEKSEWGYVTSLSWSLDGKYIAYSDRRSTNEPASLFLLSVESLEKQRLTFPPELSWGDIHAAFSRDGQSVAFARYSSRVRQIYTSCRSRAVRPGA